MSSCLTVPDEVDLRTEVLSHDKNNVNLDEISIFHHFMPRSEVEERNITNARRKQGETERGLFFS